MNRKIALLLLGLLGANASFAGDMVVIVNPAATPPTREEITDVFLGKSRIFTPIDQPEFSQIRADFYLKATGRDLAQVKSAWSRIAFTGRGRPPKELPDAATVKQAVAADPKAIGYIDKAALDATVKAVLVLN